MLNKRNGGASNLEVCKIITTLHYNSSNSVFSTSKRRKYVKTFVKELRSLYRVCQGLWPSLTFADENIELQNFWASFKSQVATAILCMHFCSIYIGWSNQGKYYEIEMHCAKQDVAT